MTTGGKVVVVVPTYNEARNLPELASRLFSLDVPGLVLLAVDDASPDGTGLLAEKLSDSYSGRIRVLHRQGKQGLGTAYVAGFREALAMGADIVVQMDADLSHPPDVIPDLIVALESADVVVGSRYVPQGGVDRRWGRGRRILSRTGNLYARLTAGLRVRDATSGFKAFRRHVLEGLDLDLLRCKGFAFQAEVAYACQQLGYRVVEYPILFHDRKEGRSKISCGIVWEALWRLPMLRWGRPR